MRSHDLVRAASLSPDLENNMFSDGVSGQPQSPHFQWFSSYYCSILNRMHIITFRFSIELNSFWKTYSYCPNMALSSEVPPLHLHLPAHFGSQYFFVASTHHTPTRPQLWRQETKNTKIASRIETTDVWNAVKRVSVNLSR